MDYVNHHLSCFRLTWPIAVIGSLTYRIFDQVRDIQLGGKTIIILILRGTAHWEAMVKDYC